MHLAGEAVRQHCVSNATDSEVRGLLSGPREPEALRSALRLQLLEGGADPGSDA
jgi:hypothetical protein